MSRAVAIPRPVYSGNMAREKMRYNSNFTAAADSPIAMLLVGPDGCFSTSAATAIGNALPFSPYNGA